MPMLFPTSTLALALALQTSASAPASPSSAALFARAARLLAERPSLSADFTIVTTYGADYLDTRELGKVSLARPGQLRIQLNQERRVNGSKPWEPTGNGSILASDGKQSWSVTTHPLSAQYSTQPVNDAWVTTALGSLAPLSGFFSGASLPDGESASPSRQTIDGETFDVIATRDAVETHTYYFDTTGFLRRVVTERAPTPGERGGRASFTRRDISLSPIRALDASESAALLAYTPPASAVRIPQQRQRASGASLVGESAPELVAEDVDGKPVKLSDFAGKPVVLKFWATWCWPCRQSLPDTERLARQNAGEATVLAVALWDSRESFRAFVRQYAAQRNTTPDRLPIRFVFDPHPQGSDVGTLRYGIRATPTQFVLDREHKIVLVESGYAGPSDRAGKALAALK